MPTVGSFEMEFVTDGVPIITRADPANANGLDLLINGAPDAIRLDGDTILLAGSVRYRPVKWDLDMEALICWRVA
jgi:hypothetical protein